MATRIIYVLGAGRSGSTIFANILGSAPGMTSIGEVYFIWDRGFRDNVVCGCGVAFDTCPFWTAVVAKSGLSDDDASEMLRLRKRVAKTRAFLNRRDHLERARFQAGLQRVYHAIGDVAGTEYLVDSSKLPVYGDLLRSTPDIDVFATHLIRDPRAVAHSWQRARHRTREGDVELPEKRIEKSLAMWIPYNLLAEYLWRRHKDRLLRVRYEDFVGKPHATLGEVGEFLGRRIEPPTSEDGSFSITTSHTLTGNPSRFETGPTRLRLDDAWKRDMTPLQRNLVTVATWPLLVRYGYKMTV